MVVYRILITNDRRTTKSTQALNEIYRITGICLDMIAILVTGFITWFIAGCLCQLMSEDFAENVVKGASQGNEG